MIEYIDRPSELKEALKVPTALMADLYDSLLKLEAMTYINEQGRVQIVDVELEDAELDKIDYHHLNTYEDYLHQVNEVTVKLVEESLRHMGLIIQ